MALFYYLEYSPGDPSGSAPSVADGAFVPLAGPLAYTGASVTLTYLSTSTPPVVAGTLYAYRSRLYDDTSGLFSDYSPVAFARAPLPQEQTMQEGILDSVITGSKVKVGIGIETREGFAVKSTKILEVSSVSLKRAIGKIYAQILRNAPTMRSKYTGGMAKLEGPLNVLLTPEGGSLLLLQAMLPDTITPTLDVWTLTSTATGGTFTATVGGQTTGNISATASAATIQAALVALSSVGAGGVVCTGGVLGTNAVVCTFSAGVGVVTFTVTSAGTGGTVNAPTHTVPGGAPYTHLFPNAFGAKSVTLTVQVGQYLFVYAGVRVVSMGFENIVAEAASMLMANTQVVALSVVVYDTVADAGAIARCGMDTAGSDTLPGYSGIQMLSSINGVLGTVRSASLTFTKALEGKKGGNGKRGFSAHYETKNDVSFSANVYFEDASLVLLDMGQPQNSTLPVGVSMLTYVTPVTLIFSPPVNGGGIVNTLVFTFPNACVEVSEEAKDEKAIDANVTFSTIDVPGDASGTDFEFSIANSVSAITAATPITNFPSTAMTYYFCAAVNATPTPTTTAVTGDNGNVGSHSTVVNDPIVLAKSIYFMSGVNAGLSRRISAYTPPSGGLGGAYTFAAFGSAPATGDLFTVC